jgi:Holliday junction resolvasome RuvABC endonuclease subunit
MRILSLDISTTTIGLAVIDYDDKGMKLAFLDYFKPPKKGSIFKRLSETKEYILNILDKYKPDDVAIEDFILFMAGKSGAKTIVPLAIINRMIGLTVLEMTGKEPHLFNVNSIRAKLKRDDKKRLQKEDMPDRVAEILGIQFPYKTKVNKKTKIQERIAENEDMADGAAVGLYFIKTQEK